LICVAGFTFPDSDDVPAQLLEVVPCPLVSFAVLPELLGPEFNARLRDVGELAPRVTVPETAMYEHHCFVFGKNDIRSPRKIFAMKPEPITHSMEK